jgi:PBP1b-binding outer membrane lipoprotein LpoB
MKKSIMLMLIVGVLFVAGCSSEVETPSRAQLEDDFSLDADFDDFDDLTSDFVLDINFDEVASALE